MYCPVCGKDMPTHAEMRGAMSNKLEEPAGVVVLCAKGHVIPEQVDDLSGFVTGDGEDAGDTPTQFTPPGKMARRRTAPTPPAAAKKPAIAAARDALKTIKARRKEIRTELSRLETLRVEDDELAAAEMAIESARRAKKVRPIREVAS